jgi:hypothetical protein
VSLSGSPLLCCETEGRQVSTLVQIHSSDVFMNRYNYDDLHIPRAIAITVQVSR